MGGVRTRVERGRRGEGRGGEGTGGGRGKGRGGVGIEGGVTQAMHVLTSHSQSLSFFSSCVCVHPCAWMEEETIIIDKT